MSLPSCSGGCRAARAVAAVVFAFGLAACGLDQEGEASEESGGGSGGIGAAGGGGTGTIGGSGGSGGGGTGGSGGGGGSTGTAGAGSGGGGTAGAGACGAGLKCQPSPPAGWTGYSYLRDEAFSPTAPAGPACPDTSTPKRYYSEPAGPAACSACSCGPVQGGQCSVTLMCSTSSSSCANATDQTGSFGSGDCEGGNGSVTTLSCKLAALPAPSVPGSCVPSVADFANKGSWAKLVDVCETKSFGACGAGNECVPTGTGDYAGYVCIYANGSQQCPSGWGAPTVVYQSGTDTRSCAACTCAPGSSSCTGAEWEFWDGPFCTLESKVVSSTSCVDLTSLTDYSVWTAKRKSWPALVGSCTATGGQPQGAAAGDPNTALTFCCKSP